MDDGQTAHSPMLNARSKEPFAMESLDTEVSMTESFSLENGAQSTGDGRFVAGQGVFQHDSRDTNTFQISSFQNEKELSGVIAHDDEPAKDERSEITKREESQRANFEFSANIEFEGTQRLDNNSHRNASYQSESWGDKIKSLEPATTTNMTSTLSGSQSLPAKNKKKPAVSAETKARWAMLRSLAGTEKNDEKDEEKAGDNSQASRGSGSQSLSFEASIKEGKPLKNEQSDVINKAIADGRRHVSPRKVDFQTDTKAFALSSKAAVESDLRRSGSGRHQSSRGEHVELDSSMSRAASVKRYMEKLRSDPHIDEKHLASLPPVEEIDPQQAAPMSDRNLNVREDAAKLAHLSQGIENNLEGQGHRIEAIAQLQSHEFNQDVQGFEHAADREGHLFGGQIRNAGRDLAASARREEGVLSRGAQGFKETLGEMGHGIERGAQALSNDASRDGRAVVENTERAAQALEASLMGGRPIETEYNRLGGILRADQEKLIHGAERLGANMRQEEQRLESDAHKVAGQLGLGNIEAELAYDQKALTKDAHQIERALGLQKIEQVFDIGKGEIRQETQKLGKIIDRENSDLGHAVYNAGEALGLSNIEGALSRDGQILRTNAHQAEAVLQSGKHMLGGFMGQAINRGDQAIGRFEGQAGRALQNEGHEIKNALSGFGNPLVGPELQQQRRQQQYQQQANTKGHQLQSIVSQGASRVPPNISSQPKPRQLMPHSETSHEPGLSPHQRRTSASQRPPSLQNEQNPSPKNRPQLPEPERQQQHISQKEVPANQTRSTKPGSSNHRPQVNIPQQLLSGPSASHTQRPTPGFGMPQHQQMIPQDVMQPQSRGQLSPLPPHAPQASQHQQTAPHQQIPHQQQDLARQQTPFGPRPSPHSVASSQQQQPTNQSMLPGRQQMQPSLIPQHQAVLSHPPLPPAMNSTQIGSKPQRSPPLEKNRPTNPPAMDQNRLQGLPSGNTKSYRSSELPNQFSSSLNEIDAKNAPQPASQGQYHGGFENSQREQPNAPRLPQIALSPATKKIEESKREGCHDENHLKAGICRKEVPCAVGNQACENSTHLASGTCARGAPCTQRAINGCKNEQHLKVGACKEGRPCVHNVEQADCKDDSHYAAGLCSKAAPCTQDKQLNICQNSKHHEIGICSKHAPCTQEQQQACCQNPAHHEAGFCSKDGPCTQDKQKDCCRILEHHKKGICFKDGLCTQKGRLSDSCKDLSHHAAGVCSRDAPCTQVQKLTNCQDTTHHAAGICSRTAPCTQSCRIQSHFAAGTCSQNSPCCYSDTQLSAETKLSSQSASQSKFRASVEIEETDHTTTSSTISMSPRLGPSDPALAIPSPHVAVFEQLVFGYKNSCQTRINSTGGARSFADQMTELFVKMAEDALPAIRQRLEENARC